MTYAKPDGVIEIDGSACCCPPGQRRPGQHTNCTTNWYRAGGEWKPLRRMQHTRELAEAAETCAEFLEAMEPRQP